MQSEPLPPWQATADLCVSVSTGDTQTLKSKSGSVFVGSLVPSAQKVLTNLDSIFKTRDIILPTKVHLVKAMVFPLVMYRCESWTIKKADAFEL